MRRIIKNIIFFVLSALLLSTSIGAQERNKGNVIDKIIAVVGNEAILLSDVEMDIYQQKIRGMLSEENIFCRVLENLLETKLLVAQAKIDSLNVDRSAINAKVEENINIYISQLGSEKAVEEHFKKPISKIREIMQDQAEEQLLAQKMRDKIVENIEVTPADAERFFKSIPNDSVPIVPEQYTFQQITIYPPTAEANFGVKENLLSLRERILKGEKFGTLARLYSEDPESAKRGGELGLTPASNYLPAFKNAALALKPGQVSQIVETEYGFHIIQMIEKQGKDLINVRHILLKPKYTSNDQRQAFSKLDSIKNLITSDTLSFDKAAMFFSQDEKTRMNGGLVANPQTLSPRFEKDQLQPSDYFVIRELKQGQVSDPFRSVDENGREVYKIIKLKEIIPSHKANLKEDFSIIKNMTLNTKHMEKLKNWVEKKQYETYIRISPDYKNCKFSSGKWFK